jgi:predicted ArsR family transcriptional regulator
MKRVTVADKLRAFFDANPDECLYVNDVIVKCECGENAARWSLDGLEREGYLKKSIESRDGSAGRGLFVYELAQKEMA